MLGRRIKEGEKEIIRVGMRAVKVILGEGGGKGVVVLIVLRRGREKESGCSDNVGREERP